MTAPKLEAAPADFARKEGSARERLLRAADELFYEEGVHTVGIDRVIERAGVAKASLYSCFGSKEALVLAYLELRAERRQQRIRERLAPHPSPRARILAVFELVSEIVTEPGFRGCAFANAVAEGPRDDGKVPKLCLDSRAWTRSLFRELAVAAGASQPERLSQQLTLLYSGALASASADRDPEVARIALSTAEQLLDEALPRRPRKHKQGSSNQPTSPPASPARPPHGPPRRAR